MLRRALSLALPLIYIMCATAQPVDTLLSRAGALHAAGANDSALVVLSRADQAARHGTRLERLATASLHGVVLRSTGRVEEALACYDTALRLVTTPAFAAGSTPAERLEAATLYLNLATLHADLQHKPQALHAAQQSLQWAARCPEGEERAELYANLGGVYIACGALQKAVQPLQLARQGAERAARYDLALQAAAYRMVVFYKLGPRASLEQESAHAMRLYQLTQSVMARIAYLQVRFAIEMGTGRNAAALLTARTILAQPGIASLPFVRYDVHNNTHLCLAALGRYREAYDELARATTLHDSLFENEKTESLRALTVKYAAREKELALQSTRAQQRAERSAAAVRLALVVSLSLVVLIALGALGVRQRRRAERARSEYDRLLAATERRMTRSYLIGLESERARLARELHDGACNDLLAIGMQLHAHPEGLPAVAQRIAAVRESIRAVSHALLPPEFRHATVAEIIADLCDRLAQSSGKAIACHIATPAAPFAALPAPIALAAYRIAQEATSNAVRAAGVRTVEVTLALTPAGRFTLTVRDDGTPPDSATRRPAGRGIGQRTMRRRAEGVGGTLTVSEGTTGREVTLAVEVAPQG